MAIRTSMCQVCRGDGIVTKKGVTRTCTYCGGTGRIQTIVPDKPKKGK